MSNVSSSFVDAFALIEPQQFFTDTRLRPIVAKILAHKESNVEHDFPHTAANSGPPETTRVDRSRHWRRPRPRFTQPPKSIGAKDNATKARRRNRRRLSASEDASDEDAVIGPQATLSDPAIHAILSSAEKQPEYQDRKRKYILQFLERFARQTKPSDNIGQILDQIATHQVDPADRAHDVRRSLIAQDNVFTARICYILLVLQVQNQGTGRNYGKPLQNIAASTKESLYDLKSHYLLGRAYMTFAKVAGLGVLALIDTSVQKLILQRRLTFEFEWLFRQILDHHPTFEADCNRYKALIEQQLRRCLLLSGFDVARCAYTLSMYGVQQDLEHDCNPLIRHSWEERRIVEPLDDREAASLRTREQHDTLSTERQWMDAVTELAAATPNGDVWSNRLVELGIIDLIKDNELSTLLLEGTPQTPVVVEEDRPSDEDMLLRTVAYASTTPREGEKKYIATIANFRQFLVFISCAELRRLGKPDERIFQIGRCCVGAISDAECERLLQAAIFMNEAINNLRSDGWGTRAVELLLVWNRPLSFYSILACSQDSSLQGLRESLSSTCPSNPQVRCPDSPFSIPRFLHCMFGRWTHSTETQIPVSKAHAEMLAACVERGDNGVQLVLPRTDPAIQPFIRLPRDVCTRIFGETQSYCTLEPCQPAATLAPYGGAQIMPLTLFAAKTLLSGIESGYTGAIARVPSAQFLPFIQLPHALCVDVMKVYTISVGDDA